MSAARHGNWDKMTGEMDRRTVSKRRTAIKHRLLVILILDKRVNHSSTVVDELKVANRAVVILAMMMPAVHQSVCESGHDDEFGEAENVDGVVKMWGRRGEEDMVKIGFLFSGKQGVGLMALYWRKVGVAGGGEEGLRSWKRGKLIACLVHELDSLASGVYYPALQNRWTFSIFSAVMVIKLSDPALCLSRFITTASLPRRRPRHAKTSHTSHDGSPDHDTFPGGNAPVFILY